MPYSKTKYRIYTYKGVDYLLYLKTYTLFWFIKLKSWKVIEYPNPDKKIKCVCNKIPQYINLKKFILKYPHIDEYFKNEYKERKNKYK
jgi:hypothetical protein